jgi:hypothetical protein
MGTSQPLSLALDGASLRALVAEVVGKTVARLDEACGPSPTGAWRTARRRPRR